MTRSRLGASAADHCSQYPLLQNVESPMVVQSMHATPPVPQVWSSVIPYG